MSGSESRITPILYNLSGPLRGGDMTEKIIFGVMLLIFILTISDDLDIRLCNKIKSFFK